MTGTHANSGHQSPPPVRAFLFLTSLKFGHNLALVSKETCQQLLADGPLHEAKQNTFAF
jgi:hypothetical protein